MTPEPVPIAPAHTPTPTAAPPPERDPAPATGTFVVDEKTGRLGEVMDHLGGCLQLRPVRGGREWDADPARVRPATPAERLSAAVAVANAISRGERA